MYNCSPSSATPLRSTLLSDSHTTGDHVYEKPFPLCVIDRYDYLEPLGLLNTKEVAVT